MMSFMALFYFAQTIVDAMKASTYICFEICFFLQYYTNAIQSSGARKSMVTASTSAYNIDDMWNWFGYFCDLALDQIHLE